VPENDSDDVTYWRDRALVAEAAVKELAAQVAALTEQVATLSKMLFGRSSEKKTPSPPPTSPFMNTGGDPTRKRGQQSGSKGHGRRDYSHLETQDVYHDVAEDQKVCPCCGRDYSLFGDETCEQIDWIVKIIRVVHHRLKYRRNCDCDVPGVVVMPPLPKAIAKGRFTSRFLARLCIEKFSFSTPVNRIAQSLALVGADFSTGTLTGSLKAVSVLLEPLDLAVRARNAQADHLHVDETSWSVFEALEGRDSNRWWLWVFVGPDTTVFRIEPSRSIKPLNDHLGIVGSKLPEGRRVIVSSDFFTVYQSLNANVEGFDSLWCWAHIRRYFIRPGDAHKELRQWRDEWLVRIGALYGAHGAISEAQPGSQQHAAALESFEAVLNDMDVVRKQQAQNDNLHEAARKALATLDNEWDGLVAHKDHIGLPLDNNAAERALRKPVVGRKNYSGSGAAWSAELASRCWTITTTAQHWNLNPLTYLTAYLDACADNNSKPLVGEDLTRFLPWTASEQDLASWREPPPP
jgi:transposase